MKRIGILLLAILLLMPQCFSLAEGTAAEPQDGQLVVGNPTKMQGYFFTNLWGNSTSDIDVRMLLHGYNLVTWDNNQGMFKVDPTVVKEAAVENSANGDRSYILTLQDDLYYSDGSKITAWDYAFSILFQIAPELNGAGGKPIRREHLAGFEEYLDGSASSLAGVRVEDDQQLVITVRGEYLPFFYEYGMLYYNPYPISQIAPGVVVKDDGDGVYLANEDSSVKDPVFTSELIKQAVLDPENGYMSHPAVVSGPYTLTSWDGTTAEFAINPYFKGDPDGNVPTIEKLVYTLADNETMVDKLASGEFGLLNKVMKADSIDAGLKSGADYTEYPRVGLSYISFSCEKPTVASQAVRQAIAWSMDRDQLVKDYTGGYGLRVDGYYGVGQWTYMAATGAIPAPYVEPESKDDSVAMDQYNRRVDAWNNLSLGNLTAYSLNLSKAKALLKQDGWKQNNDGILEKNIDGQNVALDLKMIYPEGNKIADSFQENLVPNLEEIGIRLTLEPVPMADLLELYYKKGDRDADMIYLATNFDVVFDPSVNFVVDQDGNENWSYTNLQDEELYELAVSMRQTIPYDAMGYMLKWIAFQERFNEVLPMLPIYSNVYYDFFTSALQNYNVDSYVTWSQAVIPATLGE